MTSNRKRGRRVVLDAFDADPVVHCEYCERRVFLDVHPTTPSFATADHRIPLARGGKDSATNVAVVCAECNQDKGPLTLAEYLALRHNQQALAHLRATISSVLNGDTRPKAETRAERKREAHVRSLDRLTHRLKVPDPDCENCGGTGWWKKAGRRDGKRYYCQCSIVDPIGRQSA